MSFTLNFNGQWYNLTATTPDGAIREADSQYGPRSGDYIEQRPTGGIFHRYGKAHGKHERNGPRALDRHRQREDFRSKYRQRWAA